MDKLHLLAEKRGFTVEVEDGVITLSRAGTPFHVGAAREFLDSPAGIEQARAWLIRPGRQEVGQAAAGGAARVFGWVIGFVVASAVVGGVVSWWNDNHWSSSSESSFLTSCEAKGPGVAYCECALHQVEQQYGPKEADSLAGNSAVVNQIAGYCTGQ